MRPKLTAWLVATLVVLSSGWTVPLTRDKSAETPYSVVCLVGVADRTIPASQEFRSKPQRLPSVFSVREESALALSGLDQSLFQRPPPATSFQRV